MLHVSWGAIKICQRNGAPRRNTKAASARASAPPCGKARPCASGRSMNAIVVAAMSDAFDKESRKKPKNDFSQFLGA